MTIEVRKSILGRSIIDNAKPPLGVIQRRWRRPFPEVCWPATITVPAGVPHWLQFAPPP